VAAPFSLSLHEAIRLRWSKLVCNVEIVLSADEAVRIQMEFWNDSHTPMCFSMVSLLSVIKVSLQDAVTMRVQPAGNGS